MTTPFTVYCTANCATTSCPQHMDNMPRDTIHQYSWLADGCQWYEPIGQGSAQAAGHAADEEPKP